MSFHDYVDGGIHSIKKQTGLRSLQLAVVNDSQIYDLPSLTTAQPSLARSRWADMYYTSLYYCILDLPSSTLFKYTEIRCYIYCKKLAKGIVVGGVDQKLSGYLGLGLRCFLHHPSSNLVTEPWRVSSHIGGIRYQLNPEPP